MFDEGLKSALKTEKLTTRDQELLKEKNLVEEKPEKLPVSKR